jgi:hypothetical protein
MQRLNISQTDSRVRDIGFPREFNWGAFFLTWIWAIGNKTFNKLTLLLLILCAVPYLGPLSAIGLMLYSGLTGNERAWKSKDWHDPEHFKKVQRRWAFVGVAQFVVALLFVISVPLFTTK